MKKLGHFLIECSRRRVLNQILITWNILIASHNQSGNCDLALQLMKKMKDSHGIAPNVFTWTSVISGHAQNNREHQALELFREMLMDGVEPNGVTIASALSACASLKALNKGKELHSVGIKIGTMGDVLVGNSVIDMYGKCGKLEAAQNIFDMISKKDSFTWNLMIGGYTQADYFGKAPSSNELVTLTMWIVQARNSQQ